MPPSYSSVLRQVYPFKAPTTSIDHLVIGGGVVGLSVAAGLVNTCGKDRTTFVVERNVLVRCSLNQAQAQGDLKSYTQVAFSGIYYPIGSVKSRLCIRGRDLLYDRCDKLDIPFSKTQKLIVATSNEQVPYIDQLQTHSLHKSFLTKSKASSYESNSVIPAYFLSGSEAREMEPDLSGDVVAALLLLETGIVDTQSLLNSLLKEIEESDHLEPKLEDVGVGMKQGRNQERGHGVIVRGTRVVRLDQDEKGKGWIVQLETGWEGMREGEKGEVESVHAEVVVNAAGLGAASLLQGVVPKRERVPIWSTKGSYMSYKGPGVSNVSRIIHTSPRDDLDHHGTHLTVDLNGNIRFGPFTESIGDPSEYSANPDFWQDHLTPSSEQTQAVGTAIQEYLPDFDPDLLTPDCAEVRPSLSPTRSGFSDFQIRHSRDRRGLVELLGFNSPGLTSSLAVGEYVAGMVRRDIWKAEGKVEVLAEGWEL